jgi:hypothetical protein
MQKQDWIRKVDSAKNKALKIHAKLKCDIGYKYTIQHDVEKYPAAVLYGTWSVAYLQKLLLGNQWHDDVQKEFLLKHLTHHRTSDGLFFPKALENIKYSKSKEYMQLHCYNYSVGAALEIKKDYDFQSNFMDEFLKPDFLRRWLNQRSLERPWEESNNIVNVASYLALCNDAGNVKGQEALLQMYDWHQKQQNSRTGGFENMSPNRKNLVQSMGGSVHNFHIHHYLNTPMNYEKIIAQHLVSFLYEGPLTACLSIDFVELACRTISFLDDPYELEQALLFHLESLLNYQQPDGGWLENESLNMPTVANGMKETIASSNSYATWFRLCSIGMIMITLFDDDPQKWNFRKTLGMGYAPNRWSKILPKSYELDKKIIGKYKRKNLPHLLKKKLIATAIKLIQ